MSNFDRRMKCSWNTGNDINSRLHGTICQYMGLPVYVSTGKGNGIITLSNPVTGDHIKDISHDDEDFDVSSIEIGYMNLLLDPKSVLKYGEKNIVVHAVREPHKKWRQGLNNNVVVFSGIDGGLGKFGQYAPGGIFSTQGFYDSIIGVFPPLDVALALLNSGEENQLAISKDVALQRLPSEVILVFYKTQNVGYMAPESKTVVVPSNEKGWIVSKYLQQFNWVVK